MKQVVLLESYKKKNAYQFFFDWFEDAWQSRGGKKKKVTYTLSWTIRMIISKFGLVFSIRLLKSRKKALLVLSAGYPSSFAFPFNYRYEIIPFIWDCWPRYWFRLFKFIKSNKVKTLFITSSHVRDLIKEKFPNLNVYWIPEGINIHKYKRGDLLKNRPIDLLELGRVMQPFHEQVINSGIINLKVHYYTKDNNLLFSSFDSLIEGLEKSKITVSYPRCYTHPEMAGKVETLTQRYWECMLSRTLIIGKAPEELVEFVGYNPVIEVDLDNVGSQLSMILENIESYQEFVDKNFETALEKASWENRISVIEEKLNQVGYTL